MRGQTIRSRRTNPVVLSPVAPRSPTWRATAATLISILMAASLTLVFSPGLAGAQDNCPPVPPAVAENPESSFTGELLWREDGMARFKVSPNPRDPKVEVFFGDEVTFLTKGETYRVRSANQVGQVLPVSNVSCGWTLSATGELVSVDRIDLPGSGLTTLALAGAVGLAVAFGLVFLLLAFKTSLWGLGRGVRSVARRV